MLPDSAETFLDWDDVENELGIPALGFVPIIEEEDRRLIRDTHIFSPVTESYRSLRTNLRFVAEQPLRSLLVTSAAPHEGKSTVAANLATAMAMENRRVVVVDADLRRPTQHKLFKVKPSPGLTDVLNGTHAVNDAIHATENANISVIPAGTVPPNPNELLGTDALPRLLGELKNRFDLVLLDSPPMLAVSDAALVACQVDGVLVVLAQGETKRVHARDTVKLLGRARATVLGAVLNRIDGPPGSYYTYYSRSAEYAPEVPGENPAKTRRKSKRH